MKTNAIWPTLRQRRVTRFCVKMLSWRMFDVEGFIEAVKARPALYNSKHQNFNRKDIRIRMWDEIGRIMYPEWESFDERDKNQKGSLMQKKWKSLKDCFNREVRLQKTQDPKRLRKKYEFYDRLSFLLQKNDPEPRKQLESPKEVKLGKTTPETVEKTPTQSFSKSNPVQNENFEGISRKRKHRNEDSTTEFKIKQIRRISAESENSDRLFLLSFINDFKKLPLATKYWVKMKFSEIMHQAAMSLEGYQEIEIQQEVSSPVINYSDEFSVEGSSPDSSSCEIFDVCQH